LLSSLVQSRQLIEIPPLRYLKDVLMRVATNPQRLVGQLTRKGAAEPSVTKTPRNSLAPAMMSRVPHGQTKRTRKGPENSGARHAPARRVVEENIIDAYGESDQRIGVLTMVETRLAVLITSEMLGTPVRVEPHARLKRIPPNGLLLWC